MKIKAIGIIAVLGVSAVSAAVVEEWNFTGGSLKSENNVGAGFFNGASNSNPDTSGNDWYNVTRGNGNSGNVALAGAPFTALNTETLQISVTLQDYDLSASSNEYFAVRFRQSSTIVGEVRFNAVNDQIQLNGSSIGGWMNGGNALSGLTSAAPVTYGLILDFTGGSDGKGSYTLWLDSPEEDGSGWLNRYASYTGDLNLSSASVDAVQWGIQEGAAGDRFGLDQIQVSRTIPEPATLGLISCFGGGILFIRRFVSM